MDNAMPAELLREKFPGSVIRVEEFRGETSVTVQSARIREIMIFLKNGENLRYDLLLDLTGVDRADGVPRFMIVYLLLSMEFKNRLRIKVMVAEDDSLDTVSDIWKSANWMEREVYDMLGIKFNNHPNLKRILLSEDFAGYPLRKDFPIKGTNFDQPFHIRLEEENT